MKAAEPETRRFVMVSENGLVGRDRLSFGLVPINALDADRTEQLLDRRQTGDYPETGLGETNGDLPEADL